MGIFDELNDMVSTKEEADQEASSQRDLHSPLSQHWEARATSLDGVRLTPVARPAQEE
jgi:hypothetical protein